MHFFSKKKKKKIGADVKIGVGGDDNLGIFFIMAIRPKFAALSQRGNFIFIFLEYEIKM